MTTSTASGQLTRAEDAYAHLASFRRGDVVDVGGEEFFQPGTIEQAQQHDGDGITAAYVLVRGCGALTKVTVAALLDGMTLTLQNEAARGNVRYFDAAGYAAQLREGGSDHRVISVDGWTCDVCGRPVNGQTDEDGTPVQRGDNVHHV